MSSPFARMPIAVLKNTTLSPWARLVHALLIDYDTEEGGCYPGRERIANDLGASIPTIDRALNELCAARLITKKRQGRGHTNNYTINHESSPVMTLMEDDSPPTTTQEHDSSPMITPESSPVRSPESSPVMTKLDVVKQDEINKTPLPPNHRPTETEARVQEVVLWWMRTAGLMTLTDRQAALQAAHTLLAAGFTLETLPGLYAHCKAEAKNAVTLPLMVKWADGYRAKAAPKAAQSQTTEERLAYLKRGKRTHSWDLPSDHQRYESSWGGELLDQDIAYLEAGR
jgi:hypothetical protein